VEQVEVSVWKGGREIDRIKRPLRKTDAGPAVVYRRRLWPYIEGSINLDAEPSAATDVGPAAAPLQSLDREDGQAVVIDAPPEARVLVDAGPGTGKTHVACARVSSLIEQGVPPGRIWVISFTRTAVLEIRQRIASALSDKDQAASVMITTLDAHAWALQSGFSENATLTGSFDENIRRTFECIKKDEGLQDYITRVRHLIIDEAQDIVGVRAHFAFAMVQALDEDAGFTIFVDPAQAIYGFTEEENLGHEAPVSLLDSLSKLNFRRAELSRVWRTECPKLREIFTGVRRKVLAGSKAITRAAQVRSELGRLAHANIGSVQNLDLSLLPEDTLVLMRRRAEVLVASSFGANVPHRLRMSGLPAIVRPWLAYMFWDHLDRRISEQDFAKIWQSRVSDTESIDPHDCWALLQRIAGESHEVVDLHVARAALSRTHPPLAFCSPEFGDRGPIIGTIHASKGREAGHVCLYLPEQDPNADDEEIRVVFVGATRARRRLEVGAGAAIIAGSERGRVWRRRKDSLQLEFGLAGDVDAEGLAGTNAFSTSDNVEQAQSILRSEPRISGLIACAERELDWRLTLQTPQRQRICLLSERIKADLHSIARRIGSLPPPGFFPHLRSVGLRTITLAPDDPALQQLHEPWRTSGFVLGPLLTGLSPGKLRKF
jgi:hypothetical protein